MNTSPQTRVAKAFRSFQPRRGRGNKMYGFRKAMPYDFLQELDDLITSARQEVNSNNSPRNYKLKKFLDSLDEILPSPN